MSATLTRHRSLKTILPWVGVGLVILLLAANLLHDFLFHPRRSEAAQVPTAEAEAKEPAAAPATTVSLPEGKWKTAQIATEPARVVALANEVAVPGRIEANTDRRVDIRPRASGVIRHVDVILGQKVKKGDRLVTLDSPDVGTARLNLRARQRELATVRFEADWKTEVSANVAALIPELRKGVEGAIIEKEYATRQLGSFRGQLLAAYAEYDIATHEEEKTSGLHKEMILGEHPAFVAKHTREGAQAKLVGALEQVRFDALQQKRMVDQQVRDAEAAVIDAAQRLRILGVSEDPATLLSRANSQPITSVNEDITAYHIVAPMDGTIIAKAAVPSQKAEMNDALFTLADLSTVWVTANVPESDFAKLSAFQNGTIRVTATAYPDRSFQARLLSIGAQVDLTTRTVPLLAETENPDDMLKLGMFVRIMLDTKSKNDALTVAAAAAVEIEGQNGVFVPSGHDGRTYTFRPVKLGREAGGRRVVLAGLKKDEPVVSSSSGAFILKSELILQNEPEED